MPIRPTIPSDFPEYVRMRQTLWPDCSDDMHHLEVQEMLDNPDQNALFVYERENGLLGGFLEASIRSRVDGSMSEQVGYIEGWYVDADLRGQGIGRLLVEAAEQWSYDKGMTEIASDAELENMGSIKAHKALGFAETSRLVHFLKPLRNL